MPGTRITPTVVVMISCPEHQTWPHTGAPMTGVIPAAVLNLKTFAWRCPKCGTHGLLTKALTPDFEVPERKVKR